VSPVSDAPPVLIIPTVPAAIPTTPTTHTHVMSIIPVAPVAPTASAELATTAAPTIPATAAPIIGVYECYFLILLFTVSVYKRGLLINTVQIPTLIWSRHVITTGLLCMAKLAPI
jgi:hypothetical protein